MKRFIEGDDRQQVTLLPECLDDYIGQDNPVRVVDVFVEELDLQALGFEGIEPAATGRPSYHPAVLLKLYIYGYLNRIQSSRRLEREAQRNVELMWWTCAIWARPAASTGWPVCSSSRACAHRLGATIAGCTSSCNVTVTEPAVLMPVTV